jgi:hypothetical protein
MTDDRSSGVTRSTQDVLRISQTAGIIGSEVPAQSCTAAKYCANDHPICSEETITKFSEQSTNTSDTDQRSEEIDSPAREEPLHKEIRIQADSVQTKKGEDTDLACEQRPQRSAVADSLMNRVGFINLRDAGVFW